MKAIVIEQNGNIIEVSADITIKEFTEKYGAEPNIIEYR